MEVNLDFLIISIHTVISSQISMKFISIFAKSAMLLARLAVFAHRQSETFAGLTIPSASSRRERFAADH
jgi:hypothetical protein